ncbi:MAG TPA: ATP-binding cassette domain-containing protein, partial [Ilumatobacteraceae bacterium]|nr:ATP-binding cassette domain-containing protein [Ilumatobacteraceae bacterium]
MNTDALVEVDNLTFAYRRQPPTITELSFRVDAGSRTALVGPSGSGKSTMLALIAGLLRPQTGSLHRAAGERELCWVGQTPVGVSRRSAIDHVRLIVACHSWPDS